ncbi:type II toxin-antitoxin system VapC family toxin [Candidatus Gottesmanbacteria bacterium]|nr:type II toxin-antitoxin system VapC family toxin [Candidatus Gottesmanbacteria bacterium]
MRIFVDAGPLRALVTPKDQWREKTLELMRIIPKQNGILITSDYVLDEAFTGLMSDIRAGYKRVIEFNKLAFNKNIFSIEWINQVRFFQSKLLFLKVSKDKFWSFTDCTSYVVMKEMKIKTVFTFDEHFKEMGFTML